ncbi:MAG: LD-carboxypeptidase [Gemmatimonadetes bacterium]|nr:LD-carboxypeptidase [Gemmatimonadota bacterium]
MRTRLIVPRRLTIGDRVALVAPASPVKNARTLALGRSRLEQLGFRVNADRSLLSEYGYLAGTDRERARDLEAALRDPDIKAIFCARGGYGVARMLPLVDLALARRHPKPLIGFSDITVLHLALQRASIVSFWGPMPCSSLGWSRFAARALQRALMSAAPVGRLPFAPNRRPTVWRRGRAEGRLTGGTLSLLTASLGTPYEVETRGRVVFLEDVDEEPYRVDRMLTQLIQAGKLRDAAGVAIGIFTGAQVRNAPARRSLTMRQVFADHLLPLKVPVLGNLAVGHVADQVTLPYGVAARMDASAGTIELLEAGVRE